jgi:hypothetical protein
MSYKDKQDVVEHIAWLKQMLAERSFVGEASDIYRELDKLKAELSIINSTEYVESNAMQKG